LNNISRALLIMRRDPQLLGKHRAMESAVRRFADWIDCAANETDDRARLNHEMMDGRQMDFEPTMRKPR
jgi:hypothetical protein